jgi:hypothetical protein
MCISGVMHESLRGTRSGVLRKIATWGVKQT